MNFGTVAILGPGLIGGSLALALAERGLAKKLVIYGRSARALDEIRTAGFEVVLSGNPSEVVRDADVVVLCVPIEAMAGLIRECRGALKPDALVTDVGSVKGSVEQALAPLLKDHARWVGSHPMAGSEQTGFNAARANLFVGASVVVTPTQETLSATTQRAEQFWTALGAKVFLFDPETHDVLVAEVSHLPHLAAAALVNQVSSRARELAGGGFRDTTRVAAGSPELWTEILLANRKQVLGAVQGLSRRLGEMQDALEANDRKAVLHFLASASRTRSALKDKTPVARS